MTNQIRADQRHSIAARTHENSYPPSVNGESSVQVDVKVFSGVARAMLLPLILIANASCGAAEEEVIGRWRLHATTADRSPHEHDTISHEVQFESAGQEGSQAGARFNGTTSYLEIPHVSALKLGTSDFTISLWAKPSEHLTDTSGDLVSCYDPASRNGFNLSVVSNAGVTGSQANFRNLQFGIDNGRQSNEWQDEGRPGKSIFIHCMAVHNDGLYVGTVEGRTNADQGHVYRYKASGEWEDLGAPWKSNGVTAMASFNGKLYVGVSRVLLHYSGLEPTISHHIGGRVFRRDGQQWTDLGPLPGLDGVNGLVNFQGRLYATGFYQPGFFLYEGDRDWRMLPSPDNLRTEAMAVHNGSLYATSYDEGSVFRYYGTKWHRTGSLGTASRTQAYYDGSKWVSLGVHGKVTGTQVYSLSVHQGKLFAGTWPEGKVYCHNEEDNTWGSTGRLGEEQEIMGACHYNGKLYAGSLPMAEVFRYDGDAKWNSVGRVDTTENVIYRRAWCMAVYRGRLFSGTFPSGHVRSFEAGKCVTYDNALPAGWSHIAAVKEHDRLKLYVNGQLVAQSGRFAGEHFDLSTPSPLRIGFGQYSHFRGNLRDVRLYKRALTATEVSAAALDDTP